MDKRKFKDGEKVRYNGCTYTIKEAHYVYYPTGSWWEYHLLDGETIVRVAEKLLEGVVIPQKEEKPVKTKGNGKNAKLRNSYAETKEKEAQGSR